MPMDVTYADLGLMTALALSLALGVAHAFEPDHLATLRLMKGTRKYLEFGLSHGLGFAVIAVPLVFLFSLDRVLEEAGVVIGIAFAVLLIVQEVTGREFEVSPHGSGVLQGALAVTPSKVLVAALASTAGLIGAVASVLAFIASSTVGMVAAGYAMGKVPEKLEKGINVSVALVAIAYSIASLLFLGG